MENEGNGNGHECLGNEDNEDFSNWDSLLVPEEVLRNRKLSPEQKVLLSYPSAMRANVLAEQLGISPEILQKAFLRLVDKGFLTHVVLPIDGGLAHAYLVNREKIFGKSEKGSTKEVKGNGKATT